MRELSRSLWAEPRPASPPTRVWRDWALVAVLATAAVCEGVFRSDLPAPVLPVVLTIGLVPTLLWRRTFPLLMVVIAFTTCAVGEVVVGADLAMNTLVFLLLLAYSLYRWGAGREAVIGTAVIVAKIGGSWLLGYLSLGNMLAGFVVVFAAMSTGAAVRYRTRARQRELDQAKMVERERLARDLHDTIAHHVSAMAIRAQAGLALMESQPSAAVDALRLIETEASRALSEMRTMVRTLRLDEPAELAPTPHIADLRRLASHARSGPLVEVEVVGDVEALSPSLGTAIYRLAQESITNARRHARHATCIHVQVAADDASVRLRVSDDGDPAATRSPGALGYGRALGYGLVGMMERADLLGGTVEAGPNPDRGWTVTAVLPKAVSA